MSKTRNNPVGKAAGKPGTQTGIEVLVAADEPSRLTRFGIRKKIKVWYADPPWDIAQTGKRGAIQHYDLMTLERIKAMGPLIQELSDDNSTLLMWVTSAALPEGIEVLRSWGFEYKSHAAWDKYHMGLGTYFRSSHETLLHGVRGKAPFKFHGQRSTLLFPRTEHSRKPDEMIPLIERLLDGPYAELFARRRPNSRSDWSVWGNEIDSDFKLPGFPVPSDAKFPQHGSRVKRIEPRGQLLEDGEASDA